jgi:DMSO reductase family type II enzyme chaperone
MSVPCREAQARSAIYELLSLGFLYPEEGTAAFLARGACDVASLASSLGWQALAQALRGVGQRMAGLGDARLLQEYTQVFGHSISNDCAPYEGEYGQAHVFQKSKTLADLNAFYSAFGVAIHPGLKDRLDHISVEMEFMHLLTLKESYALLRNHGEARVELCRRAQGDFLAMHLADWVGAFARRLRRKATPEGVYGALAHLLEVHIGRELSAFPAHEAAPVSGPGPDSPQDEEPACDACPLDGAIVQEVVAP